MPRLTHYRVLDALYAGQLRDVRTHGNEADMSPVAALRGRRRGLRAKLAIDGGNRAAPAGSYASERSARLSASRF